MRLQDYLDAKRLHVVKFADIIGVSRQAVERYRRRVRIPEPAVMAKIYAATNGAVEPNDFYDLPDIEPNDLYDHQNIVKKGT